MTNRQKQEHRQKMRILRKKDPELWRHIRQKEQQEANRRYCADYARRHRTETNARVRGWQRMNSEKFKKQQRRSRGRVRDAKERGAGQLTFPLQPSAPEAATAHGASV